MAAPRFAPLLLVAALSACGELSSIPNPLSMSSAAIHVEPRVTPADSMLQRAGQPIVLMVGDIADARPGTPGRRLGDIRTTVIDMSATSLTLDEDVAALMTKALRRQLAADGFRVTQDAAAPRDFSVDARARQVRLDIVDRDELDLEVDLTLRDGHGGDVLWAGSVSEKSSRFAGIAGDSRSTIVAYLTKGLADWSTKASASVRDNLRRSFPQSLSVAERRPEQSAGPISGVTTSQAATSHETVATPMPAAGVQTAAPAAAISTAAGRNEAPTAGKGRFVLTTTPGKAKVYIGDVYYGVSPLQLDLDPGIVDLRCTLDGYRGVSEKVSIRRGEATELELKFEK